MCVKYRNKAMRKVTKVIHGKARKEVKKIEEMRMEERVQK